ncbi:hypothetical protein AAHC03_017041 [Spirometra sp. Aus1]
MFQNTSFTLFPSIDATTERDGLLVNSTSTTSKTLLMPPLYYSLPFQILGTIAAILILSVGLSGNILVIVVILWSSKMRTPTNCYLVSLSFSDLLFLLNATAPLIWELYVMIQEWTLGLHACRLIVAIQYLSVDASALSMAAFSVERWVAICHPMRAQTLCSVNRALKIIAGIWIFCTAYNVVWLFTLETQTVSYRMGTYEKCTFKPSWFLKGKRKEDESEDAGKMIRRRFQRPSLRKINPVESAQTRGHICMANRLGSRAVQSRKQVVKMLMAVVFLFAIFWLPYRAWVVYNSFAIHPRVDYWFTLFARTMAYLNSAVNPILYNAMSKKFRRSFKTLLTRSRLFCNVKIEGQNVAKNQRVAPPTTRALAMFQLKPIEESRTSPTIGQPTSPTFTLPSYGVLDGAN